MPEVKPSVCNAAILCKGFSGRDHDDLDDDVWFTYEQPWSWFLIEVPVATSIGLWSNLMCFAVSCFVAKETMVDGGEDDLVVFFEVSPCVGRLIIVFHHSALF